MWDYMNHGVGWGHGIAMVLFWIVLIFVVFIAARALTSRSADSSGPAARSALDVLKERYARGEIGKEEFEQKQRDLRS